MFLCLQTCAEETLAKAETALREREQQLIHLRAEHDALRAELTAVKEGLSSSTERAEKLREEGQVCALVSLIHMLEYLLVYNFFYIYLIYI